MIAGEVPAYATTPCPTHTSTFNGGSDSIKVKITGADGSCPTTYSSSGTIHYVLSTGSAQNPCTVVLSNCSGPACPPSQLWIGGWGPGKVGPSFPTLPYSFTLDATVQKGKECDTAPLKIDGTSGAPAVILEAGVGGDCGSTTTTTTSTSAITSTTTTTTKTTTTSTTTTPPTVPEFPVGLLPILLVAIPLLVLIRRRFVSVPTVGR